MHPMRALFLIPRNPAPRLKSKKWWVSFSILNGSKSIPGATCFCSPGALGIWCLCRFGGCWWSLASLCEWGLGLDHLQRDNLAWRSCAPRDGEFPRQAEGSALRCCHFTVHSRLFQDSSWSQMTLCLASVSFQSGSVFKWKHVSWPKKKDSLSWRPRNAEICT